MPKQPASTNPAPVAIYGMSADPAHKGHLKVAESVMEMGYSRVVLMLTPQNPLKQTTPTPFVHRMELARRLVGRRTWLELSDAEAWMQLYGDELRTHTMFSQLRKIYPDTPFTFIIGSDNWMHFHTWGRFREILDLCAILIIPRPGGGNMEAAPAAIALKSLKDTATTGPVTQGTWRVMEDMPGGNASAKQIRQKLSAGEDVSRWLTADQIDYIAIHNLYS